MDLLGRAQQPVQVMDHWPKHPADGGAGGGGHRRLKDQLRQKQQVDKSRGRLVNYWEDEKKYGKVYSQLNFGLIKSPIFHNKIQNQQARNSFWTILVQLSSIQMFFVHTAAHSPTTGGNMAAFKPQPRLPPFFLTQSCWMIQCEKSQRRLITCFCFWTSWRTRLTLKQLQFEERLSCKDVCLTWRSLRARRCRGRFENQEGIWCSAHAQLTGTSCRLDVYSHLKNLIRAQTIQTKEWCCRWCIETKQVRCSVCVRAGNRFLQGHGSCFWETNSRLIRLRMTSIIDQLFSDEVNR